MSTAYAGTALLAYSAYQSYSSAQDANDANAASLDVQREALAQEQQAYDNSVNYFSAPTMSATQQADYDRALASGASQDILNGIAYVGSASTEDFGLSPAMQASMDAMDLIGAPGAMVHGVAYNATASSGTASSGTASSATASEVDFTEFISMFDKAIGENNTALTEFNRRYGSIMDNVADSVASITAESIAVAGREQLSFDAGTIRNDFTQQLAASGMGLSGMSQEMEMRIQADMAVQARSIDVNAEYQANDLRNQGVQTLNSMENIQQGIYARSENLYQNEASGLLQGAITDANNLTNTSLTNATNSTNVSMANAANATNVSMANAQNATNVSIGNATNSTNVSMANATYDNNSTMAEYYTTAGAVTSSLAAQNSFYAGTSTPPSADGVSSAYDTQAASYQSDADGYASLATNVFQSDTVQNMFTPSTSTSTTNVDPYSDIRLKKNIKFDSVVNGYNVYTWDWEDEAIARVGSAPTRGVLAQEIMQTRPDLISKDEDGYLMVNYGGL